MGGARRDGLVSKGCVESSKGQGKLPRIIKRKKVRTGRKGYFLASKQQKGQGPALSVLPPGSI